MDEINPKSELNFKAELNEKLTQALLKKGFILDALSVSTTGAKRTILAVWHKTSNVTLMDYEMQTIDEIVKDLADHADWLDKGGH